MMSRSQRVLNGVNRAFEAAGDLVVDMQYIRKSEQSYDVDAGAMTSKEEAVPLKAIIGQYHAREIAGLIQAGDAHLTVQGEGLNFTPIVGHTIKYGDTTWHIISVEPAMAGDKAALYVIQVRK